jgi:hypothetical protein
LSLLCETSLHPISSRGPPTRTSRSRRTCHRLPSMSGGRHAALQHEMVGFPFWHVGSHSDRRLMPGLAEVDKTSDVGDVTFP